MGEDESKESATGGSKRRGLCEWPELHLGRLYRVKGVADRYNTALILRDSSPFATLYHLTITASYYGIFHEITARHFSAFCCIFYDWTSDRRHHLSYFANHAHRLAARRFVGCLRPEPVHYRQKNRFGASALNRNPAVLRNRCMVLKEACYAHC